YLAHRKRGVEPAIALGDDDAFISLDAFALAFDDAYADDDGIARCEFRDRLAQACDFFLFELLDYVHCRSPDRYSANSSCSCAVSARPSISRGRRSQVRPNACILRQRAIAA